MQDSPRPTGPARELACSWALRAHAGNQVLQRVRVRMRVNGTHLTIMSSGLGCVADPRAYVTLLGLAASMAFVRRVYGPLADRKPHHVDFIRRARLEAMGRHLPTSANRHDPQASIDSQQSKGVELWVPHMVRQAPAASWPDMLQIGTCIDTCPWYRRLGSSRCFLYTAGTSAVFSIALQLCYPLPPRAAPPLDSCRSVAPALAATPMGPPPLAPPRVAPHEKRRGRKDEVAVPGVNQPRSASCVADHAFSKGK